MKKVRLKSVKGPAFVKQEWHIKKNLNSKGSFAQEPYITGGKSGAGREIFKVPGTGKRQKALGIHEKRKEAP